MSLTADITDYVVMYLDPRLVLLFESKLVVVEVCSSNICQYDRFRKMEFTYTTVKDTLRESIFCTIMAQSSASMGFSPSVTSTIFLVHVFLVARYWAWASIPTIKASRADRNV
jgi:hypothetical protein